MVMTVGILKRANEEKRDFIDISKFNENDPCQHQMKMLFRMGIYVGLHGNAEHTNLEIWNIMHRVFLHGHPYVGYEYFGFNGLVDAIHNLSVHTNHVQDSKTICVYQ